MKKMTAFVMALALVCTNVPANLHVQTGTETVYAAQETAINSEGCVDKIKAGSRMR